jgi:flagellar hook-associated protein 1
MSISVGLTGLKAAQYAITTTGSNITNAATEGYARRRVAFTPQAGTGGVAVGSIDRLKNAFVEDRLQTFEGKLGYSEVNVNTLTEIEGLLGEPGDEGISVLIEDFLNQWQSAAARPEDINERNMVLMSAQALTDRLNTFSNSISVIRNDLLSEARQIVDEVNALGEQVIENNALIRAAVGSEGGDLGVRDDQDRLARKLSRLIGSENVTVNGDSMELAINGTIFTSSGGNTRILPPQSIDDGLYLNSYDANAVVTPSSGRMAAIMDLNQTTIPEILSQVDEFATELIRLVNSYHSEGLGTTGRFTSISSEQATKDINGDGNANNDLLANAGLGFTPTAGDLTINIVNSLGAITAETIAITPNTQSLNDVVGALDALTGISASASNGKMTITADAGYSFDFTADQGTDILAALAVNSFFSGTGADDLKITDHLTGNPEKLACARTPSIGDGSNAALISDLRTATLAKNSSLSIPGLWQSVTAHVGGTSASAQRTQSSAESLHQIVMAQEQDISGVSLDEEASRLLQYNQMYTSCAKYISIVSKMQDYLLSYI